MSVKHVVWIKCDRPGCRKRTPSQDVHSSALQQAESVRHGWNRACGWSWWHWELAGKPDADGWPPLISADLCPEHLPAGHKATDHNMGSFQEPTGCPTLALEEGT